MLEWHILLSTLALILMSAAGLQAMLLAMQNYYLKHHAAPRLLNKLPPLQSMEKFLFVLIFLGFFALSVVIVLSLIAFHPIDSASLRDKTALSFIAWAVFAILLLGRSYFGWRGPLAIRWTLIGVFLLLIIYCGTGLILHARY